MSGHLNPGTEIQLNLKNMPENFHPAAAWTRVVVVAVVLLGMSFVRPIGVHIYSIIGGIGIVMTIFGVLADLAVFLVCVGTRLERWFPRPKSTKSWGARTAIGWNLHLSKFEADGVKELLMWRINIHSIMLGVLFLIYSRFMYYPDWDKIIPASLVSGALAFVWNDQMRRLSDTMAKSDPRVATLIY